MNKHGSILAYEITKRKTTLRVWMNEGGVLYVKSDASN